MNSFDLTHQLPNKKKKKTNKLKLCVTRDNDAIVCLCVPGSRTAEPSPQGSPTLGQQSSTSEDIWVLRKPLAGEKRLFVHCRVKVRRGGGGV